jgi:hypothetical protein
MSPVRTHLQTLRWRSNLNLSDPLINVSALLGKLDFNQLGDPFHYTQTPKANGPGRAIEMEFEQLAELLIQSCLAGARNLGLGVSSRSRVVCKSQVAEY